MKCDPNLYRGAPPSLAVKPRLLRHLLLPPLIILMMIGLGYAGYRISEHFGITTPVSYTHLTLPTSDLV